MDTEEKKPAAEEPSIVPYTAMIPYKPKKFEYSKIIVGIIAASWLVAFIDALIYSCVTVDSTIVSEAIQSAEKLTMVVVLAYLWKAKCENLIKLKKMYGKDADIVLSAMNKEKQPEETTTEYDSSLHF